MQKWFDEFNRMYFGGLPQPKFVLSRSKSQLGTMACKCYKYSSKRRFFDFSIRMSTMYDFEEREAQNVLLHEMIHYSIAYTGLQDTSSHGVIFRGMMDSLNRKHGWNIRISTPKRLLKLAAPDKPKEKKPCMVLYCKVNGENFLSSVMLGSAGKLEYAISHSAQITEHRWYSSSDPFFMNMRKVRTLRGVKVSDERLAELLKTMKPLR